MASFLRYRADGKEVDDGQGCQDSVDRGPEGEDKGCLAQACWGKGRQGLGGPGSEDLHRASGHERGRQRAGSDGTGSDRRGSDCSGSDGAGSDRRGSDCAGSDGAGSERGRSRRAVARIRQRSVPSPAIAGLFFASRNLPPWIKNSTQGVKLPLEASVRGHEEKVLNHWK